MRVARLVLIVLLLGLLLAGPKAVFSKLFPLRYTVATVVDFDDNGVKTRQPLISGCEMVNASDSLFLSSSAIVTSERHWIKRRDGSLWVFGPLHPCRWTSTPLEPAAILPLRLREGPTEPQPGHGLTASYTYRYDNPNQPSRLDVYRTEALFQEGVDGLKVSAWLGPDGDVPLSDTLRAAFPWLTAADKAAEAQRAERSASALSADAGVPPNLFVGFSASARRPRRGACSTPNPQAEGPILVEEPTCFSGVPCRSDFIATQWCDPSVGGLPMHVSAGFERVDFRLAEARQAFVATYLPATMLRNAGAPGDWQKYGGRWRPLICVDGLCTVDEPYKRMGFYYPARNVLVEIASTGHAPYRRMYLAEPGADWGGWE